MLCGLLGCCVYGGLIAISGLIFVVAFGWLLVSSAGLAASLGFWLLVAFLGKIVFGLWQSSFVVCFFYVLVDDCGFWYLFVCLLWCECLHV